MATDVAPSAGPEDEVVGNGIGAATRAHFAPFVTWMLLIFLLPRIGIPEALGYALRTGLCLGLFVWYRPWRWYAGLQTRHLLAAALMGVVVCVVWVLPESPWFGAYPGLQSFYLKYLMLPFGKLPDPIDISPFAPEYCGWFLTGTRLFGSAFVIAVIEEFFWRGFLYRWLQDQDFLAVDLGKLNVPMFLLVCLFFGFEHSQWFVGILAGLGYGWLAVRTRDLWAAALAHVITNLLLGLYVLASGQYGFW